MARLGKAASFGSGRVAQRASKAIDKNGKALAGAAKTSSIDKCMKDIEVSCEVKAIDKDGKPLAGAAKTSSITKCVKEAGA